MLGFDKFFENKTLMFSAGAAAFLVAAILVLFIIRLVFGRRLHMPGGGRARQPRLGVVDAFDLDRQRQLVIVRRDNVEHLVMIGGPNDILIESQIVRAEARETPRLREKEPAAAPLTWPGGLGQPAADQQPAAAPAEPKFPFPQPVSVAMEPAPLPKLPGAPAAPAPFTGNAPVFPPAVLPSTLQTAPGTVEPPPAMPGAIPPKRAPFPPPLRRTPPPPPSFGSLKPAMPPAAGLTTPGAADPAGLPGPSAAASPGLPSPGAEPGQSPLPPAPFPQRTGGVPPPPSAFLRSPLRPPLNPIVPPVVASPSRPDETFPSAAPAVVTPKPAEPNSETEQDLKPADALESLEEEMAKLLGRGTKDQI